MTAHVYPWDEADLHVTDGTDCPCQPLCEPVEGSDGSIGWMYTHRRLR